MAWPLTPLTTYLPRGLPPIKASDLNAIQNAINRNFLGTYSHFGLVLDAIGGQDATPNAGSLSAEGSISCLGTLSVGGNASLEQSLGVGSDITSGGALTLGARGGGTSVPTPAVRPGTLYADSCVAAFGQTDNNGNGLVAGFGVQSVAKGGTGVVDVTLRNPALNRLIPIGAVDAGTVATVLSETVSNNVVRFSTFAFTNGAWQFFDLRVSFVVFAV
jgi:hypothetical protein